MSRRKKQQHPFFENILITDVAAEGKAIAKVNDLIIFVSNAVPGDVVDIQVNKKRKQFMEAYVTHFHEYASIRTTPFCSHFGICGGCKWQNLPYEEQLHYKQKQIYEHLKRIGKIELPEFNKIIPSEEQTFYRNKLEFTFSNKRWRTAEELDSEVIFSNNNALGFHIPGRFDKVLDIEKCYLQDDLSNQIRNFIKSYALEHHLSFFDLKEQTGFLRTLIVRNTSIGEWMVILAFYYEDKEAIDKLLSAVSEKFKMINSLMYVINPKANDTISDLDIQLYKGKDYITEKMEDLSFKVGPKSFYQTNSKQAYQLYLIVREFAQIKDSDLVYDLYTGTGTIANFVAKEAKQVIGIEYVPDAIEDAKENSTINKINNTLFYAGDMKDVLTEEFIDTHGKPDIIITDPPRAGMHTDVIKAILLAQPEKIVYVSCNSATQARDLNLLDTHYKVTKVQPVDMFPHTHHVENVVLLEKNKV